MLRKYYLLNSEEAQTGNQERTSILIESGTEIGMNLRSLPSELNFEFRNFADLQSALENLRILNNFGTIFE